MKKCLNCHYNEIPDEDILCNACLISEISRKLNAASGNTATGAGKTTAFVNPFESASPAPAPVNSYTPPVQAAAPPVPPPPPVQPFTQPSAPPPVAQSAPPVPPSPAMNDDPFAAELSNEEFDFPSVLDMD